jgi:uncharacterized membrane protein YjfL (UPF0719 family)
VNGHILQFVAHLGVFVVLIVIARFILNRWASIESDNDSAVLEGEGNMAVAIRHGAFYIAFGIALFATMELPGGALSFGGILLESLAWGAGIMVALFLSLFINDKLVLPYVDNSRAIGQNYVSVAMVEMGTLLGSAFIMSGTMHGTGSILSTIVFFLIGQIAMVSVMWLYDKISPIDYQNEIGLGNNVSAGIHIAGKVIAIALILRNAVSGDSQGWTVDLLSAGLSFVVGWFALFIVEWLVDLALFPNVTVKDLIAARKAPPIVLLSAISIATALFVTAVSPF